MSEQEYVPPLGIPIEKKVKEEILSLMRRINDDDLKEPLFDEKGHLEKPDVFQQFSFKEQALFEPFPAHYVNPRLTICPECRNTLAYGNQPWIMSETYGQYFHMPCLETKLRREKPQVTASAKTGTQTESPV